jgi:hypothetical protein
MKYLIKSKDELHTDLYNWCRWKQFKKIIELFKENPDLSIDNINIIFNDGVLFHLSTLDESGEILNTLLDFYKKTNLNNDQRTDEYKQANYKIRQILEDLVDSSIISDDFKMVIKKHGYGYILNDEKVSDTEEARLKELDDELEAIELSSQNDSSQDEYQLSSSCDNLNNQSDLLGNSNDSFN